jgi:hypothetical protein
MSKPNIYFNDYVSLAIMLLMIIALVSAQASASGQGANAVMPVENVIIDDNPQLHLSGYLSDHSLSVSINVVKDSGHFRGEDE